MLVPCVVVCLNGTNPVLLSLFLASALDSLVVGHHELVFCLRDARTEAVRGLNDKSVDIELWRIFVIDFIKLMEKLAHKGVRDPQVVWLGGI